MRKWIGAVLRQAAAAIEGTDHPASGLLNLERVGPRLWRGSQPEAQGWRTLWDLGVRDVVKLNNPAEGSDLDAGLIGMRVQYCELPPASAVEIDREPAWADLASAVNAIRNTLHQRMATAVYVHCTHGHDRTGLVVACYRVWEEKWTKAEAEKEMLARGFHPELVGLWKAWQRVRQDGGGW